MLIDPATGTTRIDRAYRNLVLAIVIVTLALSALLWSPVWVPVVLVARATRGGT